MMIVKYLLLFGILIGRVELFGFELANSYYLPNKTVNIELSGDYAFVVNFGDSRSKIEVFNVSNPLSIHKVSSCDTPNTPLRLAIRDSLVYVADYYNGFYILNYSDITSPTLIGSCAAFGNFTDIALSGDCAYLAGGSNGIVIIDISNPKEPRNIGTVWSRDWGTDADEIEILDTLLCFVGRDLFVCSIGESFWPTLLGSCNTLGATQLKIKDNSVFVADHMGGLSVVNINTPKRPKLISNIKLPGYTIFVEVGDSNLVYTANGPHGITIIDVSSLDSMEHVLTYDTPGRADHIRTANGYAFLADFDGGLHVFDLDKPKLSSVQSHVNSSAYNLAMNGDLIYTLGYGVKSFNLSDLPTDSYQEYYDSSTFYNSLTFSDSSSFLCSERWRALKIFDDRYELASGFRSEYNFYRAPCFAIENNGHLFVANNGNGLVAMNIDDPDNPSAIDSLSSIYAQHLIVEDDVAYIASNIHGLTIVNVSDVNEMTIIGTLSTSGPAIKVLKDSCFVYIANGFEGIDIINVFDPYNPVKIGNYDTPGYVEDLLIIDNKLYVADNFSRIPVYDISNPYSAYELGSLYSDQGTSALLAKGSKLYTAENSNGFSIIDLGQELKINHSSRIKAPPISINCYPSPFGNRTKISLNSNELGAELIIKDIEGKLLLKKNILKTTTEVVWDGFDSRGNRAKAGIYVIILSVNNGVEAMQTIIKAE